jgi:hypothetical protein
MTSAAFDQNWSKVQTFDKSIFFDAPGNPDVEAGGDTKPAMKAPCVDHWLAEKVAREDAYKTVLDAKAGD